MVVSVGGLWQTGLSCDGVTLGFQPRGLLKRLSQMRSLSLWLQSCGSWQEAYTSSLD